MRPTLLIATLLLFALVTPFAFIPYCHAAPEDDTTEPKFAENSLLEVLDIIQPNDPGSGGGAEGVI